MKSRVETLTPPNTPTPIGPYKAMKAAYVGIMGDRRPARTVVGVHELPKAGALLTMNLTAVTKERSA